MAMCNLRFMRTSPKIDIQLNQNLPSDVDYYTTGNVVEGTVFITVPHGLPLGAVQIHLQGILNYCFAIVPMLIQSQGYRKSNSIEPYSMDEPIPSTHFYLYVTPKMRRRSQCQLVSPKRATATVSRSVLSCPTNCRPGPATISQKANTSKILTGTFPPHWETVGVKHRSMSSSPIKPVYHIAFE